VALKADVTLDDERTALTKEALKRAFLDDLFYVQGKFPALATQNDYYQALSYAVRDRMLQRWISTAAVYTKQGSRTVAYLSAEFLMGPHLGNNLINLGIHEQVKQAVTELGLNFDDLLAQEEEPGLGNGGLGRLAACFIDSLATLEIPAMGYGIRYEFGIFQQDIVEGWQVEKTDKWLRFGNPWEIVRPEWAVNVQFGGSTEQFQDEQHRLRIRWVPAKVVVGVPYDTPILGYHVNTANTLRLWKAEAPESFDFAVFNRGDYYGAVHQKVASENLSKVLYPNDEQSKGKELRLEQQYFFVSCSLQDMLRILHVQKIPLANFHEKFAVQLNDTHPAIAVAELLRLLLDDHAVAWDDAWSIVGKTFAYTNHTLLPEALEQWPLAIFSKVLPRHLELIYEINARFLDEVRIRFFGNEARLARLIIDQRGGRTLCAHGTSGLRRQPHDQWRGGAAFGASETGRAQGFLRVVAGQVHQQDQRRDTEALDGAGESTPVWPDYGDHRAGVDQGSVPVAASGAAGGRCRVQVNVARHQVLEQARLRRLRPDPYRGHH
jgi:starch phosphorylase